MKRRSRLLVDGDQRVGPSERDGERQSDELDRSESRRPDEKR